MFFRLTRIARHSGRELITLWFVCRNRATPLAIKAIALLLVAYVVSPVDIVPDVLPILGWLDDLTLLAFGVPALLSRAPVGVLAQARTASQGVLSKLAFWR